MTERTSERTPERLLAGRYRLVEQLGRGGMGVVWRAVDGVLHREVAVKVLRVLSDASPQELEKLRTRMRREARAAARIQHTGVITVHDVAEEDGRPAVVMELVDGPSLADVVAERGPLDPRKAASIGAHLLDALDAAHQAGVVHRDVKPANILLGPHGRVVLTDFGIAGLDAPGDGADTSLTLTGHVVGSLDYLSPERAQGLEPGPAADIWSVGMTLYTAVEGRAPFHRGSAFATFTAIVNEPLPASRRAGPLAAVLETLTHKDPRRRPGAAQARDLLTAIANQPDASASSSVLPPAAPAAFRHDVPSPRSERAAEPPGVLVQQSGSEPRPEPGSSPSAEGQQPSAPGSLSRWKPPVATRLTHHRDLLLTALAMASILAGAIVYTFVTWGSGGPRSSRPGSTGPGVRITAPATPSPSLTSPSGTPSAGSGHSTGPVGHTLPTRRPSAMPLPGRGSPHRPSKPPPGDSGTGGLIAGTGSGGNGDGGAIVGSGDGGSILGPSGT